MRSLAWQERAACAGLPLGEFFADLSGVGDVAQRACSACPVADPCRAYGRSQSHGVWGGELRDGKRYVAPPVLRTAVPEALQGEGKEPYSLPGRTNTTTEEPDMTAKTTAPKPAPTKAATTSPTAVPAATTVAPDTAESMQADVETRAKSTVCKDGTAPCPVCKESKAVTTFPTVKAQDGSYSRSLMECRACRDARRALKRATRDRAAAAT